MPREFYCKNIAFMQYLLLTLLTSLLFLLTGCGVKKTALTQTQQTYPGIIYLKSYELKSGLVGLPPLDKGNVVYIRNVNGTGTKTYYDSGDIDRIEFDFSKKSIVRYMPVKNIHGNLENTWVVRVMEGPYLSVYMNAETYISEYNNIKQKNIRQNPTNNTAIYHSNSLPIYLFKEGRADFEHVALHPTGNFESLSFRTELSSYISDDPQLSEYMHIQKWNFANLDLIVQNYNPHRGNSQLIIGRGMAEAKY